MYFVKGVQRDIRAVFDRPLKHGATECVVARDEGSMACARPIVSATRRIIAMSTKAIGSNCNK